MEISFKGIQKIRKMKPHRYNCVQCGQGFHALATDTPKFCKKKCAIAWTVCQGMKWKAGMWKPRIKKTWSTEEKIKYIEGLKM